MALTMYQQALSRQPNNAHVKARITELRSSAAATGAGASQSTAPGSAGIAPVGAELAVASAPASGAVAATALGRGGSTQVTAAMPLDSASLAAMRQKYLNQPEFRACWITRNDWASPNSGQVRAKIVDQMNRAAALNMNAVFFQVRGEATTLYPSQYEPWSRLLGGKSPGFDPVQFAIEEAHKRKIQFHAYYNACTCSDERGGPRDQSHIWYQHCTPQANPNWLVYQGGQQAPFEEYWWFNVNLPEVQTYIRMTIVDFVSRYDIDGLHFDRIRFPNGKVSDDPWSKARYAADANPRKLAYAEWQRENLNQLVNDIYGAVTALKPKIVVSAAVWGIYDKTKLPSGGRTSGYSWTSSGLQDFGQDSMAWLNRGSVDMLVPMIYWDMGGEKPDFDELLGDFKRQTTNGRFVVGGQKCFDGPEMLRQTVAANELQTQGVCPFTLSRIYELNMQHFYKTNIYPNQVPTPALPWKENPTTGNVIVVVKNGQGVPVVDASVTMAGRQNVWLSSADGYCAIIDAPPGPLALSATKNGTGTATSQVNVQAGASCRADLVMK